MQLTHEGISWGCILIDLGELGIADRVAEELLLNVAFVELQKWLLPEVEVVDRAAGI